MSFQPRQAPRAARSVWVSKGSPTFWQMHSTFDGESNAVVGHLHLRCIAYTCNDVHKQDTPLTQTTRTKKTHAHPLFYWRNSTSIGSHAGVAPWPCPYLMPFLHASSAVLPAPHAWLAVLTKLSAGCELQLAAGVRPVLRWYRCHQLTRATDCAPQL